MEKPAAGEPEMEFGCPPEAENREGWSLEEITAAEWKGRRRDRVGGRRRVRDACWEEAKEGGEGRGEERSLEEVPAAQWKGRKRDRGGRRLRIAAPRAPSVEVVLTVDDDDDGGVEAAPGKQSGAAAATFSFPRLLRELGAGGVPRCCRPVDGAYEPLGKVGEGSYGVVFKARDRTTGEIVALKKMEMEKGEITVQTYREIAILSSLRHHPSFVRVREVVVSGAGSIFLAMEYMDHDLHCAVKKAGGPLGEGVVKHLMRQLLLGIKIIHRNGVLHRDLKPKNLLVSRRGDLKICDFGLSRVCSGGGGGGAWSEQQYTDWVVTLWYRAPELLLNAGRYSAAVDMWSAGCIMAELVSGTPLFPGKEEIDQLHRIFRVLGTPDAARSPRLAALLGRMGVAFAPTPGGPASLGKKLRSAPASPLSDAGLDLLARFLSYDPANRITAEEALDHRWFRESPAPTRLQIDESSS